MRVPEIDKTLFKLFTYWYYSLFWNHKWDERSAAF